MKRRRVSVVMATYNRAHLLRRSIEGYNRSLFPLDQIEVVVVDDGSADDTADVVSGFDSLIDVKYVRLRKPPGLWRDCAAVINHGIRIATGKCIIITHPEIVPGRTSIRWCSDECIDENLNDRWVSCRGYYLKTADMKHLDAVNFDHEGPLACRKIPGFYDHVEGGNPGFHPLAVENADVWHSWIFGAAHRSLWKRWGGVIPTERWGSVDITLMARRNLLGIATFTPADSDATVAHLNHDDEKAGQTPRVEFGPDGWRDEVQRLGMEPQNCVYPSVDEIGW